jgi:hypothetical protein
MFCNKLILFLALLIPAFPSLAGVPQQAPPPPVISSLAPPSSITITGVLFPNETDQEGNPLSVYVEVLGKEESGKNTEYFIVNDAKGKELMKFLYNNVNVTGMVAANPMGNMMLTVQKFAVVESKPEDLEDEY